MRVTVIGGGSTYTPELVSGFLARITTLPISELWLMDTDARRLDIVGGFVRRMVRAAGTPFSVHLTNQQREAIAGAQYVITQLRVGKMAARREDEYLGRRHGLIGQETTGVGGMAKALRTIPVLLGVAAEMAELAPDALLVNFTNPAGLITEALSQHAAQISTVGVCNSPVTTQFRLLEMLDLSLALEEAMARVTLHGLGLNHLSWYRGLIMDGEDLWPRVMERFLRRLLDQARPEWDPALIRDLNMVPNYYLQYFYDTEQKLQEQQQWPPSRAEQVMGIEQKLLRQYADPARSEPPPELMKRGGAYYSTVATQVLNAHYNDLGEVYTLNMPHRGAVAGLPPDWVMELPCRVDAAGVHPLPADPLPRRCASLVARIKAYELLTVTAAVTGEREPMRKALLLHPLGPKAEHVDNVLEDLLHVNRGYLPQFAQAGDRATSTQQDSGRHTEPFNRS